MLQLKVRGKVMMLEIAASTGTAAQIFLPGSKRLQMGCRAVAFSLVFVEEMNELRDLSSCSSRTSSKT